MGFSHDNANRRTQLTLPNGVTVAYTHDADSHMTGITYSANATQLGNLTYTYDADGRRTQAGGSLAAVNLPNLPSATYNADNEMTAFGTAALTYDANGNLTSDGANSYAWDARNHLSQISGSVTASFIYDALGRRTSKTVGANVTQFLYDGLNPVQELSAAGTVSANLLTGLNIDEYFTRADSSGAMVFLADALGSTVGLVNSAGSIATNYTYQPFGNVTVGGAPNTNPYEFAGRENDGTGLYFYRARYHSPIFQRFVAQDPADFMGGLNLYAYAINSPGNFRDPSGLWVGGIGVNAGAGAVGGGASRTTEIVFDGQGNVGKATTTCAGGLTTVAAAGGGAAISFNPGLSTIFDLQGSSLEVGTAFPVGEGVGAGLSGTVQNNSCGQPTGGINIYLGVAGDWPSIPITLGGLGCNTTVTPITWNITGPTISEFPVLVQ